MRSFPCAQPRGNPYSMPAINGTVAVQVRAGRCGRLALLGQVRPEQGDGMPLVIYPGLFAERQVRPVGPCEATR